MLDSIIFQARNTLAMMLEMKKICIEKFLVELCRENRALAADKESDDLLQFFSRWSDVAVVQ